MHVLRLAVGVVWVLFWVYWFTAARGVKTGRHNHRGIAVRVLAALVIIGLVRVTHLHAAEITSPGVGILGVVIFVGGLTLAIWARLNLGRNWGMPMTRKNEPELVTTGPYRLIRHPIYTGLILGLIGSAFTLSLIALIVAGAAGAYFVYAASVEERNLAACMPETYPAYRARTKLLIPYLL